MPRRTAVVTIMELVEVPAADGCGMQSLPSGGEQVTHQQPVISKLWEGTAWAAATAEAKAHVAAAVGDLEDAQHQITVAAERFTTAGQTLDAERCRRQAAAW